MANYKKEDARAWSRQNMLGCSAVTIPTFTSDLKNLNEKAIRFDVQKALDLGYTYTLLCAEVAITPEENAQYTAWAKDTVGDKMKLIFHAAFGTLADNIHAAKLAEKAGADMVLLAYPPQFWPSTEQEIYDYTKEFCDSTTMGVMIFPIPMWGFERVHPAGMSLNFVRKLLKDIPNIVAIKSEQGYPLIGGVCEMFYHFNKEVVISCPIESDAIPLMGFMNLQFSGTSNTQWMSDYYPKAFALAQKGQFEKAMELYWQVNPARGAHNVATQAYFGGAGVLNRTMWKYQDWLAGFNGGPLRAPAMRIPDRFMKSLRAGLVASHLPVTDDPDHLFMVGRHPA